MILRRLTAPSLFERWAQKVEITDTCWLWNGGTCGDQGYGKFTDHRSNLAHRFAYETFKNQIPRGLHIDHLCRNPRCVNPNHLEIVTQKENLLRGKHVIVCEHQVRGITNCSICRKDNQAKYQAIKRFARELGLDIQIRNRNRGNQMTQLVAS